MPQNQLTINSFQLLQVFLMPHNQVISVHKVQLVGNQLPHYNINESIDLFAQNSDNRDSVIDHGTTHHQKAGIKLIPKSTIKSILNQKNLVHYSCNLEVKVHPTFEPTNLARMWSTPPQSINSLINGNVVPTRKIIIVIHPPFHFVTFKYQQLHQLGSKNGASRWWHCW